MRFHIVGNELTRSDSGAVDHELESAIDITEFVEAQVGLNFAAAARKRIRDIIEVNRCVHNRTLIAKPLLERDDSASPQVTIRRAPNE